MADTVSTAKPKASAPTSATRPTPTPATHEPFSAFRAEMDRLFESFFGGEPGASPLPRPFAPWLPSGAFAGVLSPSVDLHESEAAVTLTAEPPGLKPEDVKLSVRGGVLTLRGEKKQEETKGEGAERLTERRWGAFERCFILPESVDDEKAEASFEHGVLTVTLPKRPEAAAGPRKIAIR